MEKRVVEAETEFKKANQFRDRNEFEKAFNAYQKVISLSSKAVEITWSKLFVTYMMGSGQIPITCIAWTYAQDLIFGKELENIRFEYTPKEFDIIIEGLKRSQRTYLYVGLNEVQEHILQKEFELGQKKLQEITDKAKGEYEILEICHYMLKYSNWH